jgi:hypothetical protein
MLKVRKASVLGLLEHTTPWSAKAHSIRTLLLRPIGGGVSSIIVEQQGAFASAPTTIRNA